MDLLINDSGSYFLFFYSTDIFIDLSSITLIIEESENTYFRFVAKKVIKEVHSKKHIHIHQIQTDKRKRLRKKSFEIKQNTKHKTPTTYFVNRQLKSHCVHFYRGTVLHSMIYPVNNKLNKANSHQSLCRLLRVQTHFFEK